MTDPLAGRVKEKTVADIVVDALISQVNVEFPKDGDARLRIYDVVAEILSGMVRALRDPRTDNLLRESGVWDTNEMETETDD